MAYRSESLHNWNPMLEDYEDPYFNSYKEGPGANLEIERQPCYSGKPGKKTGPVKLFVGTIPVKIDQDGIENIFRNFGKPLEVFRKAPEPRSSNTWAFVTFATYREAYTALRALHMKPPLHLKVEFSKGTEVEEPMPIKPRKSYPTPNTQEISYPKRSFSRPPQKSCKGRGLVLKPFIDPRAHGDGIIGRDPKDMSRFQPYSGSKYDESNTTIMRGMQRAAGPRGPRKYIMGRGCFDRELDLIIRPQQIRPIGLEVRSTLENYVQCVNGRYEFGKKEIPKAGNQGGTCTLCGQPSLMFCQRCKDWYCSRMCQIADWPRHKKYCLPPNLVRTHSRSEEPAREQMNGRKSLASTNDQSDANSKLQTDRKEDRDSYIQKDSSAVVSKGKNYGNAHRKSPNLRGNISQDCREAPKDARNDQGCRPKTFHGKEKEQRNSLSQRHQNVMKTDKDASVRSKYGPHQGIQNSASKDRPDKFQSKNSSSKDRPDKFQSKNSSPKDNPDKFQSKNSSSKDNPDKFQSKNSSPKDNPDKFQNKDSSCKGRSNKCQENEGDKNIKLSKEDKNEEIFKLTEKLSPKGFVKVKVEIPLGPYEFWGQKAGKVHDILSISSSLEKCQDSPQLKPMVGAYCMASYQGMWFRGKVSAVRPQIRINYIDFGNEDPAELNELKELPDVGKHLKAQAIKIRLSPGTSDKYKDLKESQILPVRLLYKKNDVNIVHVQGEDYGESEVQIEEIDMQNVLVLLKPKMCCYAFITEYNDPEDFLCSLVPGYLIDCYNGLFYGALKDDCEREKEKYVPQLGESILGKFSEGWLRGVVVHISSTEEYIVASCDTGLVESVKEVRKMPPQLREITQFVVHCRVLNNIHKAKKLITETKKLSVIVKDGTSDSAIGYIESADKEIICEMEITKWAAPFELYEALKCVELKDGPCVVTAHMSAVDLYVRPMTSECIELFNFILQEVARHCFGVQPLDHVPRVGEVLAAQFSEDGNYYRAIVREVNRLKGVKVQYIDFGNIEYVSQDLLKPLSETLRKKQCLAVKVKLKDVDENAVNDESIRYFKEMVTLEKELTIKLNSGNNDVELNESDGTSVNKKLNVMLQPVWKKKGLSNIYYTIDDLVFEELDVGSHVDLAINSVIDYESILVRHSNSKSFRELKTNLEKAMHQYCTEMDEPYTPRPDELCLAELDGVWYRCCCLGCGTNLNLLFLDTGEIKLVPHTRIRRMPKDFINLPICGLFCKVKTCVAIKDQDVKDAVEEFFRISRMINAEVLETYKNSPRHTYLIKVEELDSYLIHIPN